MERTNTASSRRRGALWTPAFGLEIVDCAVDTVDEAVERTGAVIQALQTLAFMGSDKFVWMQDASFLHEGVVGRSASVKDALAPLAELIAAGLPTGTRLLITTAKLGKRSTIYKACATGAHVAEFSAPDRPHLVGRHAEQVIREECKRIGLSVDSAGIKLLVQRAGSDTRQIVNELEKLSLYIHPRTDATRTDVGEIASWSSSVAAWDLPDAIGRRDVTRSIAILRRLIFQREEPIRLIAGIEGRFRDLLTFREGLDRGWVRASSGGGRGRITWDDLPPEADAALKALPRDPRKEVPFRAQTLAAQASQFTVDELQGRMREIVATHERMVSSSVPAPLLLEYLVLRLARREAA